MMRIDAYIFECGLASSRTEAKNLIKEGAVTYFGKVIDKPSYDFCGDIAGLSVDKEKHKYVSRGGMKLEYALEFFKIDVKDKFALDVGASSGGFTDCLLQRGAKSVIAVDSGKGQLVPKIREDARVICIENYNARYMKKSDLIYEPDLAVMDVSFISATYIIPSVYEVLASGGEFVCLIKPQFEVGKSNIGKGGIVKSEQARQMAVDKVLDFAKSTGFEVAGVTRSAIEGGDGNIEFIAHFLKKV